MFKGYVYSAESSEIIKRRQRCYWSLIRTISLLLSVPAPLTKIMLTPWREFRSFKLLFVITGSGHLRHQFNSNYQSTEVLIKKIYLTAFSFPCR